VVQGKRERERERGKVLEMSRNINMWSGRVREVQEESATDTHTHTHTHILTHTKRCARYRSAAKEREGECYWKTKKFEDEYLLKTVLRR